MKDKHLWRMLNRHYEGEGFYDEMVKELQERFDKPREMHRIYVDNLINMEPVKATQSSITAFADHVCESLDGLERLKQADFTYVATSMVASYLPEKIRMAWEEKIEESRQVPSARDLIKFLRRKADNPMFAEKSTPSKHQTDKKSNRSQP